MTANQGAIRDGSRTGAGASLPRSLPGRVAAAWRGRLRQTLAAEHPGESRLLAYAMGGCFVLLLARLPLELRGLQIGLSTGVIQAEDVRAALPTLTAMLASGLFFTPLFLYGLAALLRAVLRLFGGTGTWQGTRHAVFWALIAASPAMLAATVLQVGLLEVTTARLALALPKLLADLAWGWFLAQGLAEAHGFRRAWPLFAVQVALMAALLISGEA